MAGSEYGERIRAFRKERGLNQFELAERTGVSRNAVAGWETGHSRPDLDTVPVLCEALGITADMFFGMEKERSAEGKAVLKLFFSMERGDREALRWQMEALAAGRKKQREERRKTVSLPRYVSVFESDLDAAAGFSAELGESCGQMTYLLADPETEAADEVITVNGRSMEPTFHDGDRVLVKHTQRVNPGEIGIFLVENEGFIKEYQPDGLHSHNPAYRVMRFHEDQTVRCVGKVIAKLKPGQIPDREQLKLIEEAEKAGNGGRK